MSMDIIHVLPDHVANQIAAGEVVNRPASAVKELLENAIDAGANEIQLIITEAGRTLIQVVDNGCGMSRGDAEKCFLRYATSKIETADDLHHLRTMGFRGEALASVAAVAQVELKTRTQKDETGTSIKADGKLEISECVCPKGTSIAVKNLYYNTPARREFLKQNETEFRYIEEEFMRVALSHPECKFEFFKDGDKIYRLDTGNLHQRIVQLMGSAFQTRLVKVDHTIAQANVQGYICKPDYHTKQRSKQYLFVNNRFVKHSGISAAIEKAFADLLAPKTHPAYFIFLEVDPQTIDVNIHPTKTEIRFRDEKFLYGLFLSVIKHAIGIHGIPPALDFDRENEFPISPMPKNYCPPPPSIKLNPNYDPFTKGDFKKTNVSPNVHADREVYQKLFSTAEIEEKQDSIENKGKILFLSQGYWASSVKSGLLVVNPCAAQERVLFERFSKQNEEKKMVCQKCLFPKTLEFSPSESELLQDMKGELSFLGWDLEHLGQNSFVLNGTPSDISDADAQKILEDILEDIRGMFTQCHESKKNKAAKACAKRLAISHDQIRTQEEAEYIIASLFSCESPGISPSGFRTFRIFTEDELQSWFNKI